MDSLNACPCKSGYVYSSCCKPLHLGAFPSSAKELMRSRFSAYALHLVDYIISTTHPHHEAFKHPLSVFQKNIQDFCYVTSFEDLKIWHHVDGEKEAFVTFTAYLKQKEKPLNFTEKSHFLKENGRWLYLDGVFMEMPKE